MLSLKRFASLANSYGADLERWPAATHADVRELLDASPEARAIFGAARAEDHAIGAARRREEGALWHPGDQDAALARLRSGVAARITAPPVTRPGTRVVRLEPAIGPRLGSPAPGIARACHERRRRSHGGTPDRLAVWPGTCTDQCAYRVPGDATSHSFGLIQDHGSDTSRARMASDRTPGLDRPQHLPRRSDWRASSTRQTCHRARRKSFGTGACKRRGKPRAVGCGSVPASHAKRYAALRGCRAAARSRASRGRAADRCRALQRRRSASGPYPLANGFEQLLRRVQRPLGGCPGEGIAGRAAEADRGAAGGTRTNRPLAVAHLTIRPGWDCRAATAAP